MDNTNEKARAQRNPSTEKPGIIAEATSTIRAFITNTKRPNVTTVTGRVNKTKSGFTNVLSTPRTTAIIIAVKKFSILIPGSKYPVINTAKALTKRDIIIFIKDYLVLPQFLPNHPQDFLDQLFQYHPRLVLR